VNVGHNGGVNVTFPRSSRSQQGYNTGQVEEFFENARRVYDEQHAGGSALTSNDIRIASFTMKKGGYSPRHVDAALERLEDAFAARERELARQTMGDEAWIANARSDAQAIVDRLGRPSNRRFDRVSVLSQGYHRAEVDDFASRILGYFRGEDELAVENVRSVVFRSQRGGYREAQVDMVLDSVISVMLAVA
jgi:DivIVA domain-containing protein